MKTIQLLNNRVLEIEQDTNAESPREEWDNMGKMYCFHRRYNLGDKHDIKTDLYPDRADILKHIAPKGSVVLPIYLYDHSGLTISTAPFSCQWDSGQLGWIVATPKAMRETYLVKRVTKKIREKATELLKSEVETYDQFLTGEVYGFRVKDANGDEEDSCWGFYGYDIKENGILEHLSKEDKDCVLAKGEL